MAKKKKTGRDPAAQKLPGRILADTHPALSIELIPRHGYDSTNTGPGSGRKFNWNCPVCKSRIRNVAVNLRTRAVDEGRESRGCYVCAERESSGERGLPEPLDEDLRGECIDEPGLTPKERLMSNTPELRLWQCRHCKHKWRTRVPARTSKENSQGCPQETCEEQERVDLRNRQYNFCLSMFVKSWQNTGYIELMEKGKLPHKHRVYWECELGHMRYATVEEVVKRHGCLTCFAEENKGKPLSHRDFKHLHGEFVGVVGLPTFGLQDVASGSSSRVVIWQCSQSEHHRWKATPARRTRDDRGCPYCAGKRVALPESLARTHRDIALEWNFEFRRAVEGHGCPFCAGKKTARNTSLPAIHPELIEHWHPTLNKMPRDKAPAGGDNQYWWQCKSCPVAYPRVVRSMLKYGPGCKACRRRSRS